jgi:hypothetical protein
MAHQMPMETQQELRRLTGNNVSHAASLGLPWSRDERATDACECLCVHDDSAA